ncbi:hypothetical protein CROQUDRAFT_671519 [Cronartium quercuum f. sp. fusiforme G11]|uniref:Uncharacterized protein n=1 Tax=Cronartium quercuum f. sp. fusiforme G11 TaxID=708437 RepID=A0A9P6NKP1_9BASI|nr:hypothetical protein CROQUDRAFT_671519 [Cronartium quercuum f. sp. fusiforme G11]
MIERHVLLNSLQEPAAKSGQSDDGSLSGPSRTKSPLNDADLATKLLTAPLVPPLGFAMVTPGVYRSGHPNYRNFAFLEGLKLTSIMYLCTDTYRPHTFNWAQERGLKIFHYRINLSKDPTTPLPSHSLYANALVDVLDRRNLPILIHCNKGQHRVGTLCALLRLFQGWDKAAVKAEWDKFLGEPPPPGRNMIWSPGPASALVYAGSDSSGASVGDSETNHIKSHKPGKVKNKFADSRARLNEWNYVDEFPMELVHVEPDWMPAWFPSEMGNT